MASKKLEAVCRSMPSMILQLYTLLSTLDIIDGENLYLLAISVVLAAVGSSATLSQLHPKIPPNIFAISYLAIHLYYICEVIVRISSLAMIFISIKYYASIPVGFEFLFRLYKFSSDWQRLLHVDYSALILWMGSDDSMHQHDLWLIGTVITLLEVFVFTFVINFADTNDLNVMRDRDVTNVITCLTWTSFVLKILLHYLIRTLPNQNYNVQEDSALEGDAVTTSKLHEKGSTGGNNDSDNPFFAASERA